MFPVLETVTSADVIKVTDSVADVSQDFMATFVTILAVKTVTTKRAAGMERHVSKAVCQVTKDQGVQKVGTRNCNRNISLHKSRCDSLFYNLMQIKYRQYTSHGWLLQIGDRLITVSVENQD